MEAIHTATCGVNEAAIMYGVPATTLKDRISGKVKHGTKSGPPKYLNDEEEKEFADFLKGGLWDDKKRCAKHYRKICQAKQDHQYI